MILLPKFTVRPWLPYAYAVGLVAIGATVRLLLGLVASNVLIFATFYPAVLLATLWGGRGPGILALVISTMFA